MEKMTNVEKFNAVLAFLNENGADAALVEFVQSRIDQDTKAKENAAAKRLEKNGGVKKDAADSDFYKGLREAIYKVMTTEFQTGDALIAAAKVVTPAGKPVLAAQVAMALKPLLAKGDIVAGEIVVDFVDKQGLHKVIVAIVGL